jgi:hypothetical protein
LPTHCIKKVVLAQSGKVTGCELDEQGSVLGKGRVIVFATMFGYVWGLLRLPKGKEFGV